jgi:hypothetical protein
MALLYAAAVLSGCASERSNVTRSVYYWKSAFALSDSDRAFLKRLHIGRMYLHVFDVVWNEAAQAATPTAMVRIDGPPDSSIHVVPVVYIASDVLRHTDRASIPALARNICNQASLIERESRLAFEELQIDCDWTLQTRDAYFDLLKAIRILQPSGTALSVTIRLHQLVHADRTGVPPADRGMLMFYNMGRKTVDMDENSIFSRKSAAAYLSQYHAYPLPLDVVLPHYGWILQFRGGRLIDLLQTAREEDVREARVFTLVARNLYRADGSFVFHGGYVMKGDLLKLESVDMEQCADAARMLAGAIGRTSRAVAIFAFDSSIIKARTPHAFEKIFDCF